MTMDYERLTPEIRATARRCKITPEAVADIMDAFQGAGGALSPAVQAIAARSGMDQDALRGLLTVYVEETGRAAQVPESDLVIMDVDEWRSEWEADRNLRVRPVSTSRMQRGERTSE